jgi:peptidoglycan hydrolase-like protein with peptidoglycan-binding domain
VEQPLADAVRAPASSAGEAPTARDDGRPPDGKPRSGRLRIAAVAGVPLVLLASAAIVVLGSRPATRSASGTGVPPGDTTATLERRTLTETTRVDGTLGHGGALDVYDRLAGTFTWLPSVGSVIRRGGTLFRVDEEPVVLMYGSLPAYRTLKAGVSDGPDVSELNENLKALGFDPDGAIGDERHYGGATAAAVRRWQRAEGLGETGEVGLGRIAFAPGPRLVSAVEVKLGEDPPGEASGKSPSKAAHPKRPAHKRPGSKRPAGEGSGSGKPAGKDNSSKESSSSEPAAAAPKRVLATTSTEQVVQLEVSADQQQLAYVGERAPVTLPDGSKVDGRITSVGTVAVAAKESSKEEGGSKPSGGGSAKISVTLALEHPVRHLDQAPVSVTLTKSIRRDVLAAPATALVATAGGGYAIEALEGVRRVQLAVSPGMFANGYVQIEGPGIRPGLTVLVPQ